MLIFPIVSLIILYLACVYTSNNFEYKKAYWFFEFCHLAGGFLVAMFLSNFLKNNPAILLVTFLIGLIWEICELIIDRSTRIQNFLLKFNIRQEPVTLPDTLLDLLLDVAGALILVKIFLV